MMKNERKKLKSLKYAVRVLFAVLCITFLANGHGINASAANLKVNPSSVSIVCGETKVIRAKGAGKNLKWSYDKKVIAVKKLSSGAILIEGKRESEGTVLKAKSGQNEASCTVTVTAATETNQISVRKGSKVVIEANTSLGSITGVSLGTASIAKATVKGRKITVRGKKAGKTALTVETETGTYTMLVSVIDYTRPGKASSTQAQYKAWRKKWLAENVSPTCTKLEAIRLVCAWVSQQKYGNHYTGYDLWRYGSGTCIAGSYMVKDFCDDLGIPCTVRFAANDKTPAGVYYASNHYNCLVRIGGKKYYVNATPEAMVIIIDGKGNWLL